MGALMPGPVTLVVANPEHRYRLACRQDPERLGLRLIGGPLEGTRCAVFQTSANRSGEPAPHRFGDIDASILAGADLVIDGGELGGEPSTVVDVGAVEEGGDWTILRQGALPADQVAARLDPLR
jgi:L-threonylcarbamoyladenylate synthase